MMAVLCLLVLSGCGKADEKKSPDRSAPAEHSQKPDESRNPYYRGLIEEYHAVLAEDPDNLAAIIALGNAYSDSGEWSAAVELYMRALKIDPRNADVRTDMGTAYRNMGKPDQALIEYRTALKHDPAHFNARYNMGIVYAFDKKDYGSAIRVWEELLKLSPNYPQAERMRTDIAAFRKALKKGRK